MSFSIHPKSRKTENDILSTQKIWDLVLEGFTPQKTASIQLVHLSEQHLTSGEVTGRQTVSKHFDLAFG